MSYSRRNFLKTTGSLTIGFCLFGACNSSTAETADSEIRLPGSLRRTPEINAWIEILADGRIRIFSGKVELGQGIRTAIRQVAADELFQRMDQIDVKLAETGITPNEGYTAGSGSIMNSAIAVRHAAATARERLLQMASDQLSVSIDKLKVVEGGIETEDAKLTFYELLEGKQLFGEVTMPVKLADKSAYRYVGKRVIRDDTDLLIRGEATFIHDLRFPNMLHARVLRPQNYQSKLLSFDEEKVQREGLLNIVRNGQFLAVITETEYEAEMALRALAQHSQWSAPDIFPEQAKLKIHLKEIADAPKTVKENGDISAVKPAKSIKAIYSKPYTMHASLGPACAIAQYDGKILHVWTHSQGIYPLRRALADMLQMEEAQIHMISSPGAGCFGHTVADDAAADAALLALEMPGKHIRVRWSREDENSWEPYGSAMIMEIEAGLDASGKIISWKGDIWSDSHSTRPNNDGATVLTTRYIDNPRNMTSRGYLGGGHRNGDPYYDFPNMQINAHFFEGPLRVSSLRSLGAFANIFAIESCMDELAKVAGKDPLDFRIEHSSDPRAITVMEKLRDMTSNVKIDSNEGLGYAFCRYKNSTSYCALAARVAVNNRQIKLVKFWATIDVGEVINPSSLKNQVEGGIVQAASWTLKEEVKFDKQRVTSMNWYSYPVLSIDETPDIEVILIDRPEAAAMGGGEVSTPPVAAAIGNAIYQASGKRIYELPMTLSREG